MKKSMKGMNWFLIIIVIVLAVLPLLLNKGSEFSGADGVAEETIQEIVPSYAPWFQPLLEPPGGETESLLFAVQAAIGAGMIGYVIGFFKGRSLRKDK
ncbi:MAG TPA: energy-coupling factor ABC transporter substrate-binding protein [Paenibacillaceae bacterium]|nr:energy-coupling factor ABC transporter substrate-binding protein [Paenibacillaceae bacterium]